MEFCVTRGRPRASTNPSSFATRSRFSGRVGPGQRAVAQGANVRPRLALLQPLGVAREHLHVGQEVVRQR